MCSGEFPGPHCCFSMGVYARWFKNPPMIRRFHYFSDSEIASKAGTSGRDARTQPSGLQSSQMMSAMLREISGLSCLSGPILGAILSSRQQSFITEVRVTSEKTPFNCLHGVLEIPKITVIKVLPLSCPLRFCLEQFS